MSFPFENLTAYQRSLELVERGQAIRKTAKDRAAEKLADQFQRAALSIPVNLAAAYGRKLKGDMKALLRTARLSAFECVPLLDLLHRTEVIDEPTHRACYRCLEEISRATADLIRPDYGEPKGGVPADPGRLIGDKMMGRRLTTL